jgi:NADPH2:quinone reductase
MRAYRIEGPDTPPILTDIEPPQPGPGQLSLRIAACGLNFADLLFIKGKYQDMPPYPFTPGLELAGTVLALGPGVQGPPPGSRVAVFAGHGGLAEQGVFDAVRAVPLPPDMTWEAAAGFQIAYGTAHLALAHKARLRPDETLLVLGAAGGVGLTAVEIGKLLGARVIACARGADKLDAARRAGADHLIDSETDDLRRAVLDLGGADVVYDPVGGDQFTAAFRACNPEARLLCIGFASGDIPQIKANHLLVKNLSVMGVYWGGYFSFAPEVVTASLSELLGWFDKGRLTPHIGHTLPFDRANDGLELLRSRRSTGKVVITMPGAAG